jgi:hypothetical protein
MNLPPFAHGGNQLAWFDRLRKAINNVDSTNDLIVDTSIRGLVLKSPNDHYWRATISNAGVITWTDLGLTKP